MPAGPSNATLARHDWLLYLDLTCRRARRSRRAVALPRLVAHRWPRSQEPAGADPVSDALARQESVFVEALDTAMRGPRRNGLFAVWLIIRACGDLLPPNPVSDRGHQKRLNELANRLRSLSMPPPLHRAIAGALQGLNEGTPHSALIALRQLVAPVRETLGPVCGNALDRAAQLAKQVRISGPK